MALAQLVVALTFLSLSSGNKDIKTDATNRRLIMNTTSQNATDQHRGENDEKHARFVRWALNTPAEEFASVPFSSEAMQENPQSPWEHSVRRSAAMMMNAAPPPLDKIDGRFVTRELAEPDFDGQDYSLTGKAPTNRRFALQPESMRSENALKHFRRKRSDLKVIPERSTDVKLVKRFDKIDHGEWPFSSQRAKKGGFGSSKRISGSGFSSWETRNLDDANQYGYSDLEKRNFDEIDRAGFHSLGRRNFDEIDRSGFHSLGRRNFDEIDRTGLYRLGKRNFDEIDRAGFHSLGKRNFDEIDRAGFHSLGRRNFDEIDRSGFHSLGRRNFDEIDRSGFLNLGKRNFDEIDRSGFHSLGKRNFDEIDRSGFHSLGRRNFDEIDRSGFHSLGRRNFDEIDKSAFRSSGKRDFDEIDRSGFRSFGKRNFDEIDRSGFRSFGKRNFDEIDRSGFRMLGKRSSEHLASFDDNLKDSAEAYKVAITESEKESFDESGKAPLRNFSKRSTTEEKSRIST